MPRIDIVRRSVGGIDKVVFDPAEVTVSIGDDVFWRNLDPQEQHWITRKGKSDDFFFPSPLAPFVPGIPADTSTLISSPEAADIDYVCSIHPGEESESTEQGVIHFL